VKNRSVTILLAVGIAAIPSVAPRPGFAQESPSVDAPRAAAPVARQSWTADRRAFAVGDVITVLVDERTLASATTGNFASDRRRRDMRVDASQSVTSSIPNVSASVGSINDAESRQRGEAQRQNRFVGEMTVRVVSIDNGLLQVRGEKRTTVDRSQQELTLTGWVRPQDVSAQNLLESWRIGDAQLLYTSRGGLDRPRGGIITRIISVFWP
jgi:flagellar L-ring protein FlgH